MSGRPIVTLIAAAEDGIGDTFRPRLDAAGAAVRRVHFVTITNDGVFTIPDDVQRLEEAIQASGAKVVYIDSIMGTLAADVRTNSDHDVRRALGPLKNLAERLSVLIIVIRHPRKAGADSATSAGGGSIAFSALARVGLYAGFDPTDTAQDPNERRRVLASAKNNISRAPESLTFTLESAANGRPRIVYGGPTSVTADELASAPMRLRVHGGSDGATKKSSAETWLKEQLANGQHRTAKELELAAPDAGLSWRTVERAATDLGVRRPRGKVGDLSVWSLPTVAPSAPPTPHVGATADMLTEELFPVAPTVAPHGGTGGTTATTSPATPRATVAPTAPIRKTDGATRGKRYGTATATDMDGADHAA